MIQPRPHKSHPSSKSARDYQEVVSAYARRKINGNDATPTAMRAVLIKRLFGAVREGSDDAITAACERIIEEEIRAGHFNLATDLQKVLAQPAPTERQKNAPLSPSLTRLPGAQPDSGVLTQVIARERLRHHMVLHRDVEDRFARIEREYAARSRLTAHGLNATRRILLYGPPGCGKSLGAERLAWATGLPLYKVRFDTLISSFFGETASNLSKVFSAAERQPCALFLDECDTIARSREERNDVGEVSRVVNMLLQLLEDFRGDGLVIAATNHYDLLDKAIYRRFDDAIELPKPCISEIGRLLTSTLSSLRVDIRVNLGRFAASLDGFSFSEIERIAHNSAKLCVMSNRDVITESDLENSASEVKRHF